jgi:LPS sulfotransferase NodH
MKESHVELFEGLAGQPDSTVPVEKKLLVLCTPRCGSTLWAEAMNSCGRLGICEEWLNYDYFEAWSEVTGFEFDLKDYLVWLFLKSSRDTGVFALKWHVGQLIAMHDDHNVGIESLNFDHVIYLYRRDKIAQAISLCKAVTSSQFRSYEEQQDEPQVSRHGIASALETVVKHDQFARKYLMKYVDAEYAYEDFCQLTTPYTREHKSYTDVLTWLGKFETGLHFHAGRLKRQANEASHAASYDFRQYIGAIK